ncbi:hypothetical protein Cgig2_013423 [Carnegiea gigantea]|uniref:Uncharacterized protein n=1 Tax=Carnegiea gigantea TaxID=171969 RepID=A0A9Q1JVH9_9CARY|nr:hypothetical protein Cgig2_013423 [Carnegiea gigantea]
MGTNRSLDDKIRGAGALRKFMLELDAWRAQIQVVVENAGFGSFYSVLHGVVDLTYYFITRGAVEAHSLEDMIEMKEGIHLIDYVDHQGNYGPCLGRLMTNLVTNAETLILSLNIKVSREEGESTYVEIRLVPESECSELPFAPTFNGRTFVNFFSRHHPQADEKNGRAINNAFGHKALRILDGNESVDFCSNYHKTPYFIPHLPGPAFLCPGISSHSDDTKRTPTLNPFELQAPLEYFIH